MKRLLIISLVSFSFIYSGCTFFRIFIRSSEDALFSSPERIKNKNIHPVKDSVRLAALWIGHSSVLIQIYDKVIITDPFLNTRLGGYMIRKKEPALDISNVTRLDLILVSHSHMDHMSFGSLELISDYFPGCNLIFPEGAEEYLPDFNLNLIRINTGLSQSKAYIGKSILIDSMKITPVYANHTGGRYAMDTYLWKEKGATGYIIEYKDVCVYFPGDTGYQEFAFREIGNKFSIDLAFIPIGPCRNCDSAGMKNHTSSLEGLMQFEDLKAKFMIPIHYGAITYFRDPDFPLISLINILEDKSRKYYGIKDRVKILKEGEQIIFN